MSKNTSLSGCAASPRSHIAAGRPLRGGRWAGPRQFLGLVRCADEAAR
ncbi:UNVERIFIED_CONTAM: hypothetical protein C7454_11580 [Acidovorax defluvii]|jgi:hypothetical protein